MATGTFSQNFVAVKEIRDGVIVLKNGGLRAVLLVSAVNLGLKSTDEQEATIAGFQSFLNTIDFSVEIVVQSRRMDMRPYLQMLDQRVLLQKEELLRIQTQMYMEYVAAFAEDNDIMKKYFFVVIPYSVSSNTPSSGGLIDRIFGSLRKKKKKNKAGEEMTSTEQQFEQKRAQLEERVAVVQQGLSSVGLKVEYLNTQSLIDVLYSLYNPGDTQKAIVGNMSMAD